MIFLLDKYENIRYIFLKPANKTTMVTNTATPTEVVVATDVLDASTSGKTMEKKVKAYTLAEIKKHNTAKDCWFAIEDKVYDVTEFIASVKHPGGEAIIQGCGTDATVLFNTRPMGSNTPHSEKARSFLPNFYIGEFSK